MNQTKILTVIIYLKELLKLIPRMSFLETNKAYFLFFCLLLNIGLETIKIQELNYKITL